MILEINGHAETIVLKPPSFAENPVYKYKIINKNGKNIAYLFINSFEESAVASLYNAFSWFKQQGADELIIDLRYNRGGYVSASAALAVMIAPVSADDIYVEYRGNNIAGNKKRSFNTELSYLSESSKISFSQLANIRLNIQRVYLLTGKHTASAAELLANNLTPYLPAIRIGAQTLGKDMASFAITDERIPVQVPLWEIHPLIYKLYNKTGVGDYGAGLEPDFFIDEMSTLPLKPLGDNEDPLVKAALSAITSNTIITSTQQKSSLRSVFDSRNKVDESIGGVLMKHRPSP